MSLRREQFEQAYAEAHGMRVEDFEQYRMADTYRLPMIAKCWRFWQMAIQVGLSPEQSATVKRPSCKRCDDQGDVFTGDYHYYGEFDPPEPIMEPCPECEEQRAGQPAGEGV